MKIFLDTSSLFSLYYQEMDSNVIESVFINYKITDIFLSGLSKIEFASTVWKKVRMRHITEMQAKAITKAFEKDFSKYSFVQIDNIIVEKAYNLIVKYGMQGLRALDSIQLSTAVILGDQADLFVSSDKLLNSFLKQEAKPVLEL